MGIESLFGVNSNDPNYITEGKDLTQQATNTLNNAGITDPRIYNPDLKYVGRENVYEGGSPGVKAWVQPNDNPNIVNLVKPTVWDLYKSPLDNPYILQHEAEHMGKSGKTISERMPYGTDLVSPVDRQELITKNYANLTGLSDDEAYKKVMQFTKNALSHGVGSHIKDNYGVEPAYIGSRREPGISSLEEVAADLGAIQSLSKKDIFADPVLQKKLFNNDPHLMEAYRSITNQHKMDAKDLTPYTAYKENIPRYQELIDQNTVKKAKGGAIDKPINGGSRLI